MLIKDQPVILLAGTEQFLKEQCLAKIKSAFLDKKSRDFNFNIFYAGITSTEKILECARTLPFLGRKRVVLVRQLEEVSLPDREFILSYVKNPNQQALLILETAEVDFNQNFFKEICRYSRVIFCRPLERNRLLPWINAYIKAEGKKIEANARQLLINNLGNDLKLLSSYLDNLILYIGKKETIELSDVEQLVGPDLNTSAFELFGAIIADNRERVFLILDSLLKEGLNSSQILGAVTNRIIFGRYKLDSSLIEQGLNEIQKTDENIKTGRQNQRLALELLMVKLLDFFQSSRQAGFFA